MAPRKNEPEIVEIDISQPVRSETGGALDKGNVMVCDFEELADLGVPGSLNWKPYLPIQVEIAVARGQDDTVLVFARRKLV
jgi:hypothetical protein